MPKNLPIGVDNFANLLRADSNYLFADKSLFIKEIIDVQSKVVLITRPRRWGKTLNMSMLHHFFAARVYGQQTQGMFDPYAIAQVDAGRYVKQHQGQYPVIFVSFKDVKEPDYQGALNKVKGLFQELFEEHIELLTSTKISASQREWFDRILRDDPTPQELESALKRLSVMLKAHYEAPVYILIDEYDTPLNAAYKYGYLEEFTGFMKNLFSAALKGNEALQSGRIWCFYNVYANDLFGICGLGA